MTDEAQNEIEKLQRLSGLEFDKEFVNYMISAREKDISEFREKADEGGRQVPELAKKMLPTLQQHLQLAQSLCRH
jgi:putative membrane protein